VHLAGLELHTGDPQTARALYGDGGWIVGHVARGALWLPYIAVPDVAAAVLRARAHGARVLTQSPERAVITSLAGAQIAFRDESAPLPGSNSP
jgi:predicted enzyme related to lactoylglutathione lyase